MQRFSITVVAVVLCVACGAPADAPADRTVPVANVGRAVELPAAATVEAGDLSTDDALLRVPAEAGWIVELDDTSQTTGSALAPSQYDGSGPATPLEPRLIVEPEPDADATTLAAYVAEAWANTGPGIAPWHEAAQAYLTEAFSRSVALDPTPVEQLIAAATAVQATTRPTPTGDRVTVTLEQVRASDEIPWRLVVVEVLVVELDGRALVASFEVVA